MSSLLRNLLIALGITLVLGLLYTTLFKGEESEEATDSLSSTETENEASLQTEKILSDIQQIESYDLSANSGIFEDPRFLSLTDSREEILEVEAGRSNPFEPVQ